MTVRKSRVLDDLQWASDRYVRSLEFGAIWFPVASLSFAKLACVELERSIVVIKQFLIQ